MKKVLSAFLILLPLGMLAYLRLVPGADTSFPLPLFHFYIVTFTTFSAAVISILLTITLGEAAQSRHVLAAVAFAAIGSIFFSHGLATPGALIDYFHPAVEWSAWMTLLAGGLLFVIGSAGGSEHSLRPETLRTIIWTVVIAILVYLGIAVFAPGWLEAIGENADPWHGILIYAVTLAAWLFSALAYLRIWLTTRNRVDGVLSFVSLWLAMATVSMHSFPLWNLSWWMYHFLLLIGFLVTIYILAREYESARQFNLLRYYLAISLIFTALLALIASDLFTRNTINSLAEEITRQTRIRVAELTTGIRSTLPEGVQGEAVLLYYEQAFEDLPAAALILYDAQGNFLYPYQENAIIPADSLTGYREAMGGDLQVEIRAPGQAPEGYAPAENVHSVVTFAPLYDQTDPSGQPAGVLQLVEEASELTRRALGARGTSLGITALTMSALFMALLLVVRRADHILFTRTNELNQAYKDLQHSEVLRDELTKMIVHDLKNPLSAIAASVDLLKMTSEENASPVQVQFTNLAQDASMRLTSLVDDILAVNRYEAQQLTLDIKNVSLKPLLQERVDGFRAQATTEQKSFFLECPSELRGNVDEVMFGRVLDNLLGNAMKYTHSEGGRIVVSAALEGARIVFHVKDNGEGVPDEYKDQIFDKFVQVPDDEKHLLRKGSGLGLAFCRMILDLHGGEIKVQDSDGGGSDFTFWIPLVTRKK